MNITKAIHFFILLILFALGCIFFSQKIYFHTADLGRHIMNGREILSDRSVPQTNYYSYTKTNYPVIMHHWGSGVVFALIERLSSVTVLHFVMIAIAAACLVIACVSAGAGTSFHYAFVSALLVIPLFANRAEVRPEIFSNILSIIFFAILLRVRTKGNVKLLCILPLLLLLWVNLHIFFPIGFMLLFLFLFEAYINGEKVKPYVIAICFCLLVSLVNPFFLKGVLYPFQILTDYGYLVAENQSLFFMQKRFGGGFYIYYEFQLLLCLIGAVICCRKNQINSEMIYFAPALIIGSASIFMVRLIPLASLFMVVPLARSFQCLFPTGRRTCVFKILISLFIIVMFIYGMNSKKVFFSPFRKNFGVGILPGADRAARFIKENNIEGPIFNNYDIGSYIIYYMYPEYRPFVDNRPEAYGEEFFRKLYVPMQEDNEVWKAAVEKYKFNTILFFRHDMTSWAQPFLIDRINDPEWIPVYVDDYVLILVRKMRKNFNIIKKYALPKSMFRVRKG